MNSGVTNKSGECVAVIGGANMDICGVSNEQLRLTDSNPGKVSTSPGGVARNIAENLTKLGANCQLFTAIGGDIYGKQLIEGCKNAGINMDHILLLDDAQTSTYLSVLDETGDMRVAINDMAIINHLTPSYFVKHKSTLVRAKIIVVDTNISLESLAVVAGIAQQSSLVVDAVSAAKALRIKPYLSTVNTLKANKLEAQAISGIENAEPAQMANWFHDQGVKNVFITLGGEGAFYSGENYQGTEMVLGNSENPVNTTGAGDAFLAGVVYAQLQNWDIKRTAKFSMCAAQLAMAHAATINPAMSVDMVNKIMGN